MFDNHLTMLSAHHADVGRVSTNFLALWAGSPFRSDLKRDIERIGSDISTKVKCRFDFPCASAPIPAGSFSDFFRRGPHNSVGDGGHLSPNRSQRSSKERWSGEEENIRGIPSISLSNALEFARYAIPF